MRIEVDPIKCEAHGLCAELLPERITLDEWGYPLIDPTPVPPALEDLARRAVSACPTLALKLRSAERAAAGIGPETRRNGQERPYQLYTARRGRR